MKYFGVDLNLKFGVYLQKYLISRFEMPSDKTFVKIKLINNAEK